jgi:hypothetical protein
MAWVKGGVKLKWNTRSIDLFKNPVGS